MKKAEWPAMSGAARCIDASVPNSPFFIQRITAGIAAYISASGVGGRAVGSAKQPCAFSFTLAAGKATPVRHAVRACSKT
jgi:hypothetical protein